MRVITGVWPEEPRPGLRWRRARSRRGVCADAIPLHRRATALLVCIFVMAITTIIVLSMIDTQTLQMKALRHTQEYEQALYLAGAAVHHAMAQIENDPSLTPPFGIGPIEFPGGSGRTYRADVVASGSDLVITGSGAAGAVTRYVQVTITQQPP